MKLGIVIRKADSISPRILMNVYKIQYFQGFAGFEDQ